MTANFVPIAQFEWPIVGDHRTRYSFDSWRTERWDSFRLLTPNWQCRLPGYAYHDNDPDGFMTMPEVVEFITGYAKDIAAPVQTGTTAVSSIRQGRT